MMHNNNTYSQEHFGKPEHCRPFGDTSSDNGTNKIPFESNRPFTEGPLLENLRVESPSSALHDVWDYIKSHNSQLIFHRLKMAYSIPDCKLIHEFLLISMGMALLAAPIAYLSHLVYLDKANFCPTVYLKALFIPCLAEETLFRVIVNPHLSEKRSWRITFLFGLISVSLYVLWHPLNAWLLTVSMRDVFYNPSFLFVTTLLGTGCQVMYSRFGSVLPSVLLHWLVVCSWVSLGGKANICTQSSNPWTITP